MSWWDFLKKFKLEKLKFKSRFLEAEVTWKDEDREAAWELYVELLTRTTTQILLDENGDEKTSLISLYKIFPITREILKKKGRKSINFTRIAVVILNQILRPFTTKWHRKSKDGAFEDENECKIYRMELAEIQQDLIRWTKMLSEIADVEDLIDFDISEDFI